MAVYLKVIKEIGIVAGLFTVRRILKVAQHIVLRIGDGLVFNPIML